MYNKCTACGKLLDNDEDRRIVLDDKGNVATKCIECFDKSAVSNVQ